MRAFDGAEVCELIGIYMLFLIRKIHDYNSKNARKYRDDILVMSITCELLFNVLCASHNFQKVVKKDLGIN